MVGDRQYRDGIALAIRGIRMERNWSQRELCRRTELSPAYLSELESARKDASVDVLERIADAFGIRMDEFLWIVLLGMLGGEIPSVQRRNAVFDLTQHMLNVDPDTRKEIEEFIQFQRWRQAGKPAPPQDSEKRLRSPALDERSERTEPDFTEEL